MASPPPVPASKRWNPWAASLHPPLYDTLDYLLNQVLARREGRDAAPGAAEMAADGWRNVIVRLDLAYARDVAAYLRQAGVAVPRPPLGHDSLAASVPIALLPALGARPVVHLVTVEPPIRSFSEGIAPHGADFWQDPGWKGSGVKTGILDTGFEGYRQARQQGQGGNTSLTGPVARPARLPSGLVAWPSQGPPAGLCASANAQVS